MIRRDRFTIKASKGETTRVMPFDMTAGSWKVKLLPKPVGWRIKASWLDKICLMMSFWFSLNWASPKTISSVIVDMHRI